MDLIRAETRLEAWAKAVNRRLEIDEQDECQFILDIREPWKRVPNEIEVVSKLDSLYQLAPLSEKGPSTVNSVAETIFPAWEYVRHGLPGAVDKYLAAYPAFRRGGNWGTYAHRLFVPADHDEAKPQPSPLLQLISAMHRERAKGTAVKVAIYEISLHRQRSDAAKVSNRPCLTHLSFKLHNDRVSLTALYRSHEYAYKVPGNLLGLARLQAAVCREVGAAQGPLVVHSTRAWIDKKATAKRIQPIAALIEPTLTPGG